MLRDVLFCETRTFDANYTLCILQTVLISHGGFLQSHISADLDMAISEAGRFGFAAAC